MVNFNALTFNRAIMHNIHPVIDRLREATVTSINHFLNIDNEIEDLFRKRLNDSFGIASKSFELEIENVHDGSCYSLIKDLSGLSNEDFITRSIEIAELLAASHNRKRIPGGYFILVECIYNQLPVYIILKAEPHSAIGIANEQAHALKDIILSPAQKMYKAVVFEQIATNVVSKEDFKTYLFDSQINLNSKLAEYFYKDFLGLTAQLNNTLQTGLFYAKMEELIQKKYLSLDKQIALLDGLRAYINNNSTTVNPRSIIIDIIPLDDRDYFIGKIVDDFPISFSKEPSLLKYKIHHKSIMVAKSLRLSGPTNLFEESIAFEDDPEDENVTIIRVRKNLSNISDHE